MGEDMVERARMIEIRFGKLVADGHRVMGCGPGTGHMFAPLAFCKDDEIAVVLADAMNAAITAALGGEGR